MKRTILWLRSNLQRRRYEREMRAEMAEHLERATRRLMSRGYSADEARREAQREFGDVAAGNVVRPIFDPSGGAAA